MHSFFFIFHLHLAFLKTVGNFPPFSEKFTPENNVYRGVSRLRSRLDLAGANVKIR